MQTLILTPHIAKARNWASVHLAGNNRQPIIVDHPDRLRGARGCLILLFQISKEFAEELIAFHSYKGRNIVIWLEDV